MNGLVIMAKELARSRASVKLPKGMEEFMKETGDTWYIYSRGHARIFPNSCTAHYYRIIDAISRGERP